MSQDPEGLGWWAHLILVFMGALLLGVLILILCYIVPAISRMEASPLPW